MPQFVPVARQTHAHKRLRRPISYSFCAQMMMTDIMLPEAARAAVEFPLVIVVKNNVPRLYVLLGLSPAQNAFVNPDGRWIGSYVPAILRAYPFAMMHPEKGDPVLGIDEACPQLSDSEGDALFEREQPSEVVTTAINLLKGLQSSVAPTLAACAKLQELDLLAPWRLEIREGDSAHTIDGMLRVDEAKLNALDDQHFLTLRASGAATLAILQIASLHNIHTLQMFDAAQRTSARLREGAPPPAAMTVESLDALELKF